ncbi:hypothetical protein [Christiangramia salexigens]|uniref:hypothetical protein n=1 Tax=Christiangramia salexigens TaxID=1913577 RepID=UPI000932C0C6|nr:hypothetical protein [Christiangramia salexigens]
MIVILLFTGILSAILTHILNNHFKMGPVKASALLSFPIGLFFFFFPNILSPELTKEIPLVFFGASFIGMVSFKVLGNYIYLILAALVFVLIYYLGSPFFKGFGGALGTTAAISVLVSVGLYQLIKQ